MKNSELDQLLKSVPVPERPASYWDQFPARVMAKTHWLASRAETTGTPAEPAPYWLRPRFRIAVVGLGLVMAGLLLGYIFGFQHGHNLAITDLQMAQARKYFQEIQTLFPGQVQAIVLSQPGARLVLAEQPNVPASAPLYLRVCGPKGCQDFLTFSGQQIRLNGEVCDVLLDPQGNVLLAGPQWVLSTAQPPARHALYQVAARPLEATL
jgi:hypothetical protein